MNVTCYADNINLLSGTTNTIQNTETLLHASDERKLPIFHTSSSECKTNS